MEDLEKENKNIVDIEDDGEDGEDCYVENADENIKEEKYTSSFCNQKEYKHVNGDAEKPKETKEEKEEARSEAYYEDSKEGEYYYENESYGEAANTGTQNEEWEYEHGGENDDKQFTHENEQEYESDKEEEQEYESDKEEEQEYYYENEEDAQNEDENEEIVHDYENEDYGEEENLDAQNKEWEYEYEDEDNDENKNVHENEDDEEEEDEEEEEDAVDDVEETGEENKKTENNNNRIPFSANNANSEKEGAVSNVYSDNLKKKRRKGKKMEHYENEKTKGEKNNLIFKGSRSKKKKMYKKYKDIINDGGDESILHLRIIGGKKMKNENEENKKDKDKESVEIKKSELYKKKTIQNNATNNIEKIDEEDMKIKLNELSHLTCAPTENDHISFAIPVCAPFSALQNNKYKIKLVPGNAKKGKVAESCISYFIKNCTDEKEKRLIQNVSMDELGNCIIENSTPDIPGFKNSKTFSKGKKK